jgi:hypothetical protein
MAVFGTARGQAMQTIQISDRTGADGMLTLRVPIGRPDTEVDVVVVVQTKGPAGGGWPPGYFDLFGSITDDTFVRPPQGELPPPVTIE